MNKFLKLALAASVACAVVAGTAALAGGVQAQRALGSASAVLRNSEVPTALGGTNERDVVMTDGGPVDEGDAGLTAAVVGGVLGVRELGPTYNPDVYVGVGTVWPPSEDTLIIALTTDDDAIRKDFLAAAGLPPEKVKFVLAHTSEARAEEIFEQIQLDHPYLDEKGIDLAQWGIAGENFEFTIRVFDLGEGEAALLRERYGPVEITNVGRDSIDIGADGGAPAVP